MPNTRNTYRTLLANRPLRRLLLGEFVSSVGDWAYLVAILVAIYTSSRDPLLLGIVGFARVAPYVVLSLPAGLIADRLDRRNVLIATDVFRGITMVALTALWLLHGPTWAMVALATVASGAAAIALPSFGAYLPSQVVDEAQLGPANSAWATLENLAAVVGPAAGGLVLATGLLGAAFVLNALTFAVVAVILSTLSPARLVAQRNKVASARGRSEHARQSLAGLFRLVAGPLLLDVATSAAAGGVSILTVILATDQLAVGEAGTGYLNAAAGLGGVVAGVAAGYLVLWRLDVPLVAGALLGAAMLILLGLSHSLALALPAVGVAAGGLLLIDVITATLIQRLVPDAARGRAIGLVRMLSAVAFAASSLLAPIAAARLGLLITFGALGATGLVLTLLALAMLRGNRVLRPRSAAEDELLELLRRSQLGILPATRLAAMTSELEALSVAAGARVVSQGEPADRLYVVASGTFRVSHSTPSGDGPIQRLGPGDLIGEHGLLTRTPRNMTVTADGDGLLYSLGRDAFLALVAVAPSLGGDATASSDGSAPRRFGHSDHRWRSIIGWSNGGRRNG